jgi:hypothetical protein
MNATFLFICREGSSHIFTSEIPPTAYDLESIAVGTLDVVRLADLRRLNELGEWEALEAGELATVVVDGETRGPFHAAIEGV